MKNTHRITVLIPMTGNIIIGYIYNNILSLIHFVLLLLSSILPGFDSLSDGVSQTFIPGELGSLTVLPGLYYGYRRSWYFWVCFFFFQSIHRNFQIIYEEWEYKTLSTLFSLSSAIKSKQPISGHFLVC